MHKSSALTLSGTSSSTAVLKFCRRISSLTLSFLMLSVLTHHTSQEQNLLNFFQEQNSELFKVHCFAPSARMRSEGYSTWSVCLCVCVSVCYHVFCHGAQQCAQQDIPAASAGHEQSFKNGVFFNNASFRSYAYRESHRRYYRDPELIPSTAQGYKVVR